MKIREVIRQLEDMASRPGREDAEFVLYDRTEERTLTVQPDRDVFDFEITDGGDEILIEFN